MFLAGMKPMEQSIIERSGYEMVPVPSMGLPRVLSPKLAVFAWKLAAGISVSRRHLKRFQPDVVIATGGYVSAPTLLAARMMHIPSVIQEQNSYPGIVSRKLGRFADAAFLGFAEAAQWFGKTTETIVTGNPVRGGIGSVSRDDASRQFSLEPTRKTVLVCGGSQGARAINGAVAGMVERLAASRIQVIWQTGAADYETYRRFDGYGDGSVRVTAFIENMIGTYAAADVVVGRAGAMTIAEIAVAGLPSVLIPLPHSAGNHQLHNARALENTGAAVVIEESALDAETLERLVRTVIEDNTVAEAMKAAAANFAKPAAVVRIADELNSRYGIL